MMSRGSKKRIFLGIDTSCYTTSAACVCVNGNSAEIVCDERTLLKVAAGERGLRQSDAVFQHVRNLAEILPKIFKQIDRKDVAGVGVDLDGRHRFLFTLPPRSLPPCVLPVP